MLGFHQACHSWVRAQVSVTPLVLAENGQRGQHLSQLSGVRSDPDSEHTLSCSEHSKETRSLVLLS